MLGNTTSPTTNTANAVAHGAIEARRAPPKMRGERKLPTPPASNSVPNTAASESTGVPRIRMHRWITGTSTHIKPSPSSAIYAPRLQTVPERRPRAGVGDFAQ